MSEYIKSIAFTLVLCLVCSLLLTGASVGLREYQQRNVRTDRQKNILQAVGLVSPDQVYSAEKISSLFTDHIRCLRLSPSGETLAAETSHPQMLQLYLSINNDNIIENFIIPIDTKGLWGKIKGYLAVNKDGNTISGFTVYKHSETPGLGGEIEKQWFQKNFVGKKIIDQQGAFMAVAVAKGQIKDSIPGDKQEHYVDGISGATLTGKYLSVGLASILQEYEPISIRFRKNQFKTLKPDQGACDTNEKQ